MKLTDESLMPFGKHKGEKMANVPASYLLWLYDEYTMPNPRFGFIHRGKFGCSQRRNEKE